MWSNFKNLLFKIEFLTTKINFNEINNVFYFPCGYQWNQLDTNIKLNYVQTVLDFWLNVKCCCFFESTKKKSKLFFFSDNLTLTPKSKLTYDTKPTTN